MIRQFNDPKRKTIALVSINSGSGCQFAGRDKLATAERYAEDMKSGDWDWDRHDARPTVFYDGEWYWLADGFHRVRAAQIAGLVEIQCDVREGTIEDAVDFAILVCPNKHHGDPEAPVTKSDRVRRALTRPWVQGVSKHELARVLGVSRILIRKVIGKDAPQNGVGTSTYPERGWDTASKPPRTPRLVTDADEAAPDDVPEVQVEEDPWATPPVDGGCGPARNPGRNGEADVDTDDEPVQMLPQVDGHDVAIGYADELLAEMDVILAQALAQLDKIKVSRASGYVGSAGMEHALRGHFAAIKAARVVRVCDECGGAGCDGCNRTGYISRDRDAMIRRREARA